MNQEEVDVVEFDFDEIEYPNFVTGFERFRIQINDCQSIDTNNSNNTTLKNRLENENEQNHQTEESKEAFILNRNCLRFLTNRKYYQSITYAMCYFSVGLCYAVLGPALVTLSANTNSSLSEISIVTGASQQCHQKCQRQC